MTKPKPVKPAAALRVLTEIELIAVFALAGWAPRQADLATCRLLGATVDVVAEYSWDHLMGEPKSPSLAKVRKTIQAVVDKFPPPAPLSTVYTFAIIDMDLLRDDVSSASGILPALFWSTREEAQAALVAELHDRWNDSGPGADNTEAEMPPVVFTENPHDEGGLTAQVEWLGEDAEVYVYALKLAK